MDKVHTILIVIAITLISLMFKFILVKLGWAMFIMPVFGVRDISLIETFGAILLFNGLVNSSIGSKKD
jgi:hypothetical protein